MTQPVLQSTPTGEEETALFGVTDDAGYEDVSDAPLPRHLGSALRGAPRSGRTASSGSAPWAEGVDPREGAVLGGRYRIERVLRSDTASVLALAFHSGLGQKVALRWLLPRAGGAQAASRFLEQARAAARLRSEHVARVIDVGRFASTLPYVATEGSDGWDLAEVLRVRGPLPVQEAVDYVLQAAEAVAEAHALGIVHGGLNLLSLVLTRRPDGSALVKVRDFGFAVDLVASAYADDGMHSSSPVLDVLAYVSPEQLRSTEDADVRADVWALGAILHSLLSGSSPFRSTTSLALLAAVAADAPLPLGAVREDVPTELEDVVLSCLQKDRADRYPTVGDLALALRSFASGNGLASIDRAQRSRVTLPAPRPSRPPAQMVHVGRPRENKAPSPVMVAAPTARGAHGWMVAVGLLGVGMGALAAVLVDVAPRPSENVAAQQPPAAVAQLHAPPTQPPSVAPVAPAAVPAPVAFAAGTAVPAQSHAAAVPAPLPLAGGVAPAAPAPLLAARPAARPAALLGRGPSAPKVETRAREPEVGSSKPAAQGADLFNDIR